jgi:hypothetical protein
MARRHTIFDMGLATAETLSHRLPMLWWGMISPGSANSAEMVKMVVEKQMAFADTVVAAQMEMFKWALQPWWGWSAATHHTAADAAMQAMMAPSARRVKANALRLRRRISH